ncbi:FecR family protein [Larkinella knui]|uniref:FecR family protein n=1 Tax=Larkinella knui TaxID=2025310 RepID=A0A3P1CN69_9BACT|nr:FecR family protein [Larkinella knui]RRB14767.1 FecR family protein [Larkinella knui]
MDSAKYQELLAKYLNGDCSEEERELIDQWYASLDTEVELPATAEAKKQLLARNWQGLANRTLKTKPVRRIDFRPYWAVAAVVAVLLGIGWYFLVASTDRVATPSNVISAVKPLLIEKINTTSKPERVILSDRSVVTLEPGSKIRYPATFAARNREVTLTGEAFFEVEKNPNQPFLVYSNDLITKVLGTSFRIKANLANRNITVSVRTGRVSVYSPVLTTAAKPKSDPETIGVVLTPNQQVTYLNQEHRLVKTLVEKPAILVQKAELPAFTFQNTRISVLMTAIEKTYGVDIVYDEEVMSKCFITTSLEQEDLYDKLNIICKLLGASYKVIDAQIVISGPGCP